MNTFSSSCLSGKNAFFYSPYYEMELKKEFNAPEALTTYQSSEKPTPSNPSTKRSFFKRLSKWGILPSVPRPENFGTILAEQKTPFKFKRVKVLVGDLAIDAAIMGTPRTFKNKKWVLVSVGRLESYEQILTRKAFQNFLQDIQSNAIVFNYPKVGVSKGTRNAKNLVAAYKGIFEFLENEKNGIGADTIIGYGYSLGGGVQGESIKTIDLEGKIKKGQRYLFIKDRTFSSLEKAVHSLTKGYFGWIVNKYNWVLSSIESSKRLSEIKIPEIIIQTTDENSSPVTDGVISKNASLKQEIYNASLDHKWYINIPNPNLISLHACSMQNFSKDLSRRINSIL